MSKIEQVYQAYCMTRPEEKPEPYFEILNEMLPRKEYMQVETLIGDDITRTEKEFFTAGFQYAVGLLREAAR
jgi:hypothetical protein